MDLAEVRTLLDRERRAGILDGGDVEVLPLVTRTRSEDNSRFCICYSALSAENADEVIAKQAEHFSGRAGEFEWKVYAHDSPPDLCDRLARHGFVVGPCEAVVVLDLSDLPSWVLRPLEHRVDRVASLDQVLWFKQIAEQVFGGDWSTTAGDLEKAIRTGSTDHLGYIAFDGDVPASIGRLYTRANSTFGGLYGGGTLTAYRQRGLYRTLVAARARDAAELGARYLLVDALPTSQPILEALGFAHLTDTWPCTLSKCPSPAATNCGA